MKNSAPLTKSDLIDALKEAGVATKSDLTAAEKRLGGRMSSVETNLRTEILSLERRLKLRIGKERNRIM